MPTPNPDSETKSEFMSRCVPIVIADGTAADGEQGRGDLFLNVG